MFSIHWVTFTSKRWKSQYYLQYNGILATYDEIGLCTFSHVGSTHDFSIVYRFITKYYKLLDFVFPRKGRLANKVKQNGSDSWDNYRIWKVVRFVYFLPVSWLNDQK